MADFLAALGIFITVWLALVAFYRAETRGLIDKAEVDIERVLDYVAEFWLSNRNDFTREELQYWTHRLSAAGDRADLWVTTCARKLRLKDDTALRRAIVDLIDAATNNAEDHAQLGPQTKKLRCTRVLGASTTIVQIVETAFDRWPRKVLWW